MPPRPECLLLPPIFGRVPVGKCSNRRKVSATAEKLHRSICSKLASAATPSVSTALNQEVTMQPINQSETIDRSRRKFLGAGAMTLAATQFAVIKSASAQPDEGQLSELPRTKPSGHSCKNRISSGPCAAQFDAGGGGGGGPSIASGGGAYPPAGGAFMHA